MTAAGVPGSSAVHIPHTLAGFIGAYVAEHGGKAPNQQEVWDAATRAARDLLRPNGVALPREPSEEQITAALSAAAFFDTQQSRKDMRKALLAAAGIVPPGQEWMWPNGIPGVDTSDGGQMEHG